ncbi:MAG: hypothetical protein M3P94_03765 [Chloroflexota bacterium]|nr:hypothetical protein [Chloroflexota bacterium]
MHRRPDGTARGSEHVNPPATERGVVIVPQRRVVGRSSVWVTRLRRLATDDEPVVATVAG